MKAINKDIQWSESSAQRLISETLRREFYAELNTIVPKDPAIDYGLLCKAWQKVTNASWTLLWLADRFPGTTELQLVAGHHTEKSLPLPEKLAVTNDTSVAAYCLAERKPVFIEDIDAWRGGKDGKYRVSLASFLKAHGCRSVLCVPLGQHIEPSLTLESWNVHAHGAVCLHFGETATKYIHTPDTLLLMASLSSHFLEACHHAHQRRLLMKLSEIGIQSVASFGQPTVERRRKYSKAIIDVLAQELRVSGISIFFEDKLRKGIECVQSTGLKTSRGQNVTNLATVFYQPGEGLTGRCYETGLPFFCQSHALAGAGQAKFLEIVQDNQSTHPAAVIYPIPRASTGNRQIRGPLAAGVLRLVQHFHPSFPGKRLKFDSLGLATVELVSREIGIVLNGMTASIQRERVLKSVQHENENALLILAPLVTRIRKGSRKGSRKGVRISAAESEDLNHTVHLLNNVSHDIGFGSSATGNYSPTLVNLLELVKEVAAVKERQSRKFLADGVKVRVQVSVVQEPPFLNLDRSMVQRALLNIIDNAIKFGDRESPIRILVGNDQAGVFVEVLNQGAGVSVEDIERIFLPEERGQGANSVQGMGMGLAVATEMILRNGGQLTLKQPSAPTIFRITLPLILQSVSIASDS